ncbi:M56 family metallopeptidase [Kribbella lupini]|uniref:M56 family metallopeptidase n=1 Tax=Kribbella lupini TaxID=291602 RepID=A0ABP4LDY9_9ACTN
MRVWVYLPLLLSVLFPLAATRMAAMLRPLAAVRVATAGAAVAALACTCSVTLLSLTLFDDLPPLSAYEGRPELGLPEPVPDWLGLIALLVVLVLVFRLFREVLRRRRAARGLRAIKTPYAGLAVADLPEPFAVAVPGRPGHVLVTSGMLSLLDAVERRVLLAHERSHLDRHHHRLVAIAAYSAAMNPLLSRLASLVTYLVERSADEDAAAEVGDRDVVARAVAKASLAGSGHGFAPALGLHGSTSIERVVAIAGPQPSPRWRGLLWVAALTVVEILVTVIAIVGFAHVAGAWLSMVFV